MAQRREVPPDIPFSELFEDLPAAPSIFGFGEEGLTTREIQERKEGHNRIMDTFRRWGREAYMEDLEPPRFDLSRGWNRLEI